MEVLLQHLFIYCGFFILLLWSRKKGGLRLFDDKGFASNLPVLLLLQAGGIVLFGVVPLLFHPVSAVVYNPFVAFQLPQLVTWMVIALVLFLSPGMVARKFAGINISRHSMPNTTVFIVYFFLRILFIAVYENWFRGYLLNDCMAAWNVTLAVALNVLLYALLHLVNGRQEFIACFPFGILLCCLCIWIGAAWPAMLVHLALTISFEAGFLQKIKKTKTSSIENMHNRGIGIPG